MSKLKGQKAQQQTKEEKLPMTNLMVKLKIKKLLHDAILNESFENIPKEYLKAKYFFYLDEYGYNIVQRAANKRKLSCIPKELLTEELLVGKTSKSSGFHIAALEGDLEQIPKEFLTHKNLSIKDEYSTNVYQVALTNGYIKSIPQKLLTPEVILEKNSEGLNLLEMLEDQMNWASAVEKKRILADAQFLIRKLPTKTLKEISKAVSSRIAFDKELKYELHIRKSIESLKEEQVPI
jgi:hypothetical protein